MKKSLIIAAIIIGCSTKKQEAPVEFSEPIGRKIMGNWLNESLTVEMSTFKNTDKDSTYFIDFRESSDITRPLGVLFMEDGTYHARFVRNNKDTLTALGVWNTSYDSIKISFELTTNSYHVQFDGDHISLIGKVDYDGDSIKDDVLKTRLLRKPL